jgi:hypothetical protein
LNSKFNVKVSTAGADSIAETSVSEIKLPEIVHHDVIAPEDDGTFLEVLQILIQ